METYRRTIYGSALQTANLLGLGHTVLPNTTLNQLFSINQSETLGVNERPTLKYIGMGIGGHRVSTGAGGITLVETIQHDATHAASYRPFPFAMRPLASDLTSGERTRYAMRRIETHGGSQYAVYYLKRMDLNAVAIEYKTKTIVSGVETTSDFVPTTDVLTPVPPVTPPGAVSTDGVYVYATARVTLTFDEFDATEILNAANVLYQDENAAFISEFSFVTGVDRSLNSPGPGATTFAMNEAVAAQVFCHVAAMQPMKNQTQGFVLTYDIGIAEPMMVLTGP